MWMWETGLSTRCLEKVQRCPRPCCFTARQLILSLATNIHCYLPPIFKFPILQYPARTPKAGKWFQSLPPKCMVQLFCEVLRVHRWGFTVFMESPSRSPTTDTSRIICHNNYWGCILTGLIWWKTFTGQHKEPRTWEVPVLSYHTFAGIYICCQQDSNHQRRFPYLWYLY